MTKETTLSREEKIKKIYSMLSSERTLAGSKKAIINLNPIMIGDVLDYLGGGIGISNEINDYGYTEIYRDGLLLVKVLEKRKKYREPIEEQSDDTVDFVYSLITQ